MRVCLQRVRSARVTVGDELIGKIGTGVVILVGFRHGDSEDLIAPMAERIANLRIFEDDAGRMNISLRELQYEVLVVSQFTLYADTQKGRRPSFTDALEPALAEKYYLMMIEAFQSIGIRTACGRFGAKMLVEIHNWGPVTLILDA